MKKMSTSIIFFFAILLSLCGYAEITESELAGIKLEYLGLEITDMLPDSQASKIGLQVGDIVVGYNGKKIECKQKKNPEKRKQGEAYYPVITVCIETDDVGKYDEVPLQVVRNGNPLEFKVRGGQIGFHYSPTEYFNFKGKILSRDEIGAISLGVKSVSIDLPQSILDTVPDTHRSGLSETVTYDSELAQDVLNKNNYARGDSFELLLLYDEIIQDLQHGNLESAIKNIGTLLDTSATNDRSEITGRYKTINLFGVRELIRILKADALEKLVIFLNTSDSSISNAAYERVKIYWQDSGGRSHTVGDNKGNCSSVLNYLKNSYTSAVDSISLSERDRILLKKANMAKEKNECAAAAFYLHLILFHVKFKELSLEEEMAARRKPTGEEKFEITDKGIDYEVLAKAAVGLWNTTKGINEGMDIFIEKLLNKIVDADPDNEAANAFFEEQLAIQKKLEQEEAERQARIREQRIAREEEWKKEQQEREALVKKYNVDSSLSIFEAVRTLNKSTLIGKRVLWTDSIESYIGGFYIMYGYEEPDDQWCFYGKNVPAGLMEGEEVTIVGVIRGEKEFVNAFNARIRILKVELIKFLH